MESQSTVSWPKNLHTEMSLVKFVHKTCDCREIPQERIIPKWWPRPSAGLTVSLVSEASQWYLYWGFELSCKPPWQKIAFGSLWPPASVIWTTSQPAGRDTRCAMLSTQQELHMGVLGKAWIPSSKIEMSKKGDKLCLECFLWKVKQRWPINVIELILTK